MTRLASRLPTWPLVLIAICLGALSLLAPLNWRTRQPADNAARQLAAARAPATSPVVPAKEAEPSEEELTPPRPTLHAGSQLLSDATPVEPLAPTRELEGATRESRARQENRSEAADWKFVATEAPWDREPAGYPGQITVDPSFPADQRIPRQRSVDKPAEEPHVAPSELAPAPVPVATVPEASAVATAWPAPTALYQLLAGIETESVCVAWATSVRDVFAELSEVSSLEDPRVTKALDRLHQLTDEAPQLAERLPPGDVRSRFLRTAYALARRIAVWSTIVDLTSHESLRAPTLGEVQDTMRQATLVEQYINSRPYSADWKRYLLIDQIPQLRSIQGTISEAQRTLARQMLVRMEMSHLTDVQASYLRAPVFEPWRQALKSYAQEPLDLPQVIAALERFEASHSGQDAEQVAQAFQVLYWSPAPATAALSQPWNEHYRNANVRVAIAGDLINRLLHETHATEEPVNDVIRDAQVLGRSQTSTRLRVELVPDRRQWRLGLEARGDVAASTESRKGPATFFQDAWSNFNARKQVTVDRRGVRMDRTEVRAKSTSDLRSFETEYDNVPVFGLFARAIARQQYHEQSAAAKAEVEQKVAHRARTRLDEEITRRLSDAEGEFHRKWLKPLQRLGLEPTAVDMETTAQRLIVRYRLAGSHQLASHTARPQAPANSWLSVQIHESAVNNTLAQLQLGGRPLTVPQLYEELAQKFDRPVPQIPDDLPDDVTVRFAEGEAVQVRCADGRVELTLRFAELAQGKQRWKNFEVHAYYVPEVNQRNANLVRDGIIELSGERRSLGNQVALRAIFAKVLSKNRPISLVNDAIAKNTQLADLEVNQFVVVDGWIGVALTPKSNTARQLGPPAIWR